MNAAPRCPACGLVLPENRLAGLCPACAWQALSEPEPETPLPAVGCAESRAMRLPGHEILGEIARGGMGIVYRARQLDPGRLVALKMLLPGRLGSAEMAERFRLEVRALTELEHAAILPVYQVGEHDGLPFFTMKLATGGTLAGRRSRYLGDWRAIAGLVAELAEAVQFAHQHGVLHRDLKPGNILFDDRCRAYVSDFGLAKLADAQSDLTRSVDFLGTPHYVAPEIAARSARYATTASDIYSLGAVLYELLAGRPPFEAEGLPGLLQKIAEDEPVSPSRARAENRGRIARAGSGVEQSIPLASNAPDPGRETGSVPLEPAFGQDGSAWSIPRDLEVICLKCLAKEPTRRYPSAGELARDLRCWLEGKPINARPVSWAERAGKWLRRNPGLTALGTALALSLLGGGFALWQSDRQVRRALGETRQAKDQAQGSLRESLLAQAEALGAARHMGQRWQALEVLARAARIQPSLDIRNEAAAALARADLRERLRFPALIGAAGSPVVFTSDLESYIGAELDGGFSLRGVPGGQLLAAFDAQTRKPARWFTLDTQDRRVAALLDDYAIEVWTLDPPRLLSRWPGTVQQPPLAAFAPDGVSLAGFIPGAGLFLQGSDETPRRWLQSTNGRPIFLRFDPAGSRLAVARDPGGVEIWSCSEPPRLLWFQPMHKVVPWLAWSPDGHQLVGAADDGRGIRVFSGDTGEIELVYSRHLLYPRQFEFDPSGREVASIGQDWTLRLWDSRSGQDLVTATGRHRVLRFSRDGRRLTTAPTDGELAVLEIAPPQVFREFAGTAPNGEINSDGLSRTIDGRMLLITHPQLHLYDTRAGAELAVLKIPGALAGCHAFFDSDNPAVFYSCLGRGIYRRALLTITNGPASATGLGWGEEQLVATHPGAIVWDTIQCGQTWVCQGSQGMELWHHHDQRQSRRVGAHGLLQAVAASQDARWAAAADTADDRITIWDCGTNAAVTNLTARSPDRVWFSPDSRWLVASVEKGYCTWSTANWQPGATWEARLDSGDPGELTFSDDASLVAARQDRETFRLLSFPKCRELATLQPPLVLPVRSACLKGDGTRLWLLTSGFRVFEWNLTELRAELRKLGLDWGG